MNAIDLICCIVLLIAIGSGWRRGFIRQACSLAGLVLALWVATRFGDEVGAGFHLDKAILAPAGFAIAFIGVLIVVAVAGHLLRHISKFIGLGALDALLGITLSVIKYALILSLLLAVFNSLNATYGWVDATTIEASKCFQPLMTLSERIFPFLEWIGEQVGTQGEAIVDNLQTI